MSDDILILETGGTRSRYAIKRTDSGQTISRTQSAFNPNIHPAEVLRSILLDAKSIGRKITLGYGFISGLQDAHVISLTKVWNEVFDEAPLKLFNDLQAVGLGLSKDRESWIGIIGTGSSLAHWNGQRIVRHLPGFGYMLGDEGSGRHIFKEVVKQYYRQGFSPSLQQKLSEIFDTSYSSLIIQAYQDGKWPELSSTWMVQMANLWGHKEIASLGAICMDEYLSKMIRPALSLHDIPCVLSGGVAMAYKDYICSQWPGSRVPEIVSGPFDQLIKAIDHEY